MRALLRQLALLAVYGALGVLAVPAGDFARLRYNPFFRYLESRLNEYPTVLER